MINSEDEAETPALRKRVLVSGDEHRNPVHRLGKTVKTSTKKGFLQIILNTLFFVIIIRKRNHTIYQF